MGKHVVNQTPSKEAASVKEGSRFNRRDSNRISHFATKVSINL